ncbi:MAG: hypothetical protein ACR2KX_00520 [Chitinophagaceae bacterium]
MKHHLSVLLVAGSICFIVSCQKESIVAPETGNKPISVNAKMNKLGVPFKASFETASRPLAFPPILRLETTGTGIGSHIGKSTLLAYPTINFRTNPISVSGTLVITAANGDEIFASFTGTRSATNATILAFTIHATYIITGGTGRFQNASGSFEGISTGTLGIHTGTASYEGYISY